jgi:hypothetical protein
MSQPEADRPTPRTLAIPGAHYFVSIAPQPRVRRATDAAYVWSGFYSWWRACSP